MGKLCPSFLSRSFHEEIYFDRGGDDFAGRDLVCARRCARAECFGGCRRLASTSASAHRGGQDVAAASQRSASGARKNQHFKQCAAASAKWRDPLRGVHIDRRTGRSPSLQFTGTERESTRALSNRRFVRG